MKGHRIVGGHDRVHTADELLPHTSMKGHRIVGGHFPCLGEPGFHVHGTSMKGHRIVGGHYG